MDDPGDEPMTSQQSEELEALPPDQWAPAAEEAADLVSLSLPDFQCAFSRVFQVLIDLFQLELQPPLVTPTLREALDDAVNVEFDEDQGM